MYNSPSMSLHVCTGDVYSFKHRLTIVGCGLLFNPEQVSKDKLKEMVENKMLVKLQDRYYSNTSQLGQVLMETMLKEVSEFCKINIQQSWATQSHQQVRTSVVYVRMLVCNLQ